jgi:5-methylcytosine-specific restriction endonuclease McrA
VSVKACLRCGRLTARGSYCPEHERERLAPKKRRQGRLRSAVERAAPEPVEREEVWRRGGGVCWLCKRPVPLERFEVDHVVPIALGGVHAYSNLRPAHPVCNSRRGGRKS